MNNKYIGNRMQLFDVREYKFTGGKAEGTRAIDIWNGANLHFTVLPDRCLDLFTVRYKNKNMAFHTPNGVVNPAYYNELGNVWLRSFGAGFMTTCGLKNYGGADGSNPELTFHGRMSNTPCEMLSIQIPEDGDTVTISGVMKEAILFGSNMSLTRTITCKYGEDKIYVKDVIKNEGFSETHLSLLYHFNMGYPLMSENSKIIIPSVKCHPFSAHAKERPDAWNYFEAPTDNFEEMLFEHELSEKYFGIDNPDINTSMRVNYLSPALTNFLEWKACQSGNYVCGLEPMTATNSGFKANVENGTQKYLKPQEKVVNTFEISFSDLA
ncbi:MAG: aldose 1-epimerase family protein [Clostridia bacterium]|nr:aldose 1-epimerase family protein [Clostridia bacterium]